jgi:7-carboxy-7-deazaguanine synthase
MAENHAGKLPVIEIFDSIQGEGSHMGKMVTFVRLAGCNLKCPWCDTKESWNAEGVVWMTPLEIDRASGYSTLVITGGEPTIHNEMLSIALKEWKESAFQVHIETNGTNPVSPLVDWVVCSPKRENNYDIHPALRPDELKYVVDEDFDGRFAIPEEIRERFCGRIWLQPEGSNPQTMERMWQKCFELVKDDSRLRVGVQLHKIMEVQ